MPTMLLISSRPPMAVFQVIRRTTWPSGRTSLMTSATHISALPAMIMVPFQTPERMLRFAGTSTGGAMS